jgi:uncharacterized protein (TIGR03084 family)
VADADDRSSHDGPPGKPTVEEIAADLAAEQRSLDALVTDLPAEHWSRATPSAGWTVTDQIGHLAYFDRSAALAINDPAAFAAIVRAIETGGRGEGPVEVAVAATRSLGHDEVLDDWRVARDALLAAAAGLGEHTRVPWYGPSMGAISFLTARLMETWAHGEDVAMAVGAERAATDRLRHVAQLGVITRSWSYAVRGATVPSEDVRVRLRAPSGATWEWHPDATQAIEGDAVDFCRVVTQRRNVSDTWLEVHGDAAAGWMRIAQAFAGAPTEGPPPTP